MTVDREKVIEGLQKTLMWADTPELLEGMSPKELYTEYECWRPEAEAVLKYFEAQDLVIVPVEPMTIEEAIGIAAQCWCTEKTKHIEMDVVLAEAFAQKLIQLQKGGSDD